MIYNDIGEYDRMSKDEFSEELCELNKGELFELLKRYRADSLDKFVRISNLESDVEELKNKIARINKMTHDVMEEISDGYDN